MGVATVEWLQPDGSVCPVFMGIAGLTLVLTFCFDVEEKDVIRSVPFLVLGLLIAYLIRMQSGAGESSLFFEMRCSA